MKNKEKKPAIKRTRGSKAKSGNRKLLLIGGIVLAVAIIAAIVVVLLLYKKNGSKETEESSNAQVTEAPAVTETKTEPTPTPQLTVTPTPQITVTPTPQLTVTPTPQVTVKEASPNETEAAELVKDMTVHEKICQLFLVTPLSMVNAADAGHDGVTQIGTTSKNAYSEYPVGGLLFSSNNIESADTNGFKTLTQDVQDLPDESVRMFAAVLDSELENMGLYLETDSLADYSINMLFKTENQESAAEEDAALLVLESGGSGYQGDTLKIYDTANGSTADEIKTAWESGYNLILSSELDFDLKSVTEALEAKVTAGELEEDLLDEKLIETLCVRMDLDGSGESSENAAEAKPTSSVTAAQDTDGAQSTSSVTAAQDTDGAQPTSSVTAAQGTGGAAPTSSVTAAQGTAAE